MPDHLREDWHDEAFPPFEARPTTFRRVMSALALCFLAIGLGIAAVVGVLG